MNKKLSASLFRSSALVSGIALLCTQSVYADATLIYEQSAGMKKTNNTMQIKDNKIRFTPPNRPDSYSLYDSQTGSLTHVDSSRKQYMSMDEQSIAEQAKLAKQQMDQMRERMMARMKDMPPEQKQQVERMMNNHLQRVEASKAKPQVERKATSQSKTISGIQCTVYETYVDGKKLNEICMTTAENLGIPMADAKALMGMQAFMKRMQKIAQDMMGSNIPSANVDGIPLHTTLFDQNGQPQLETRLVKISTDSLDSSLMTLPAGYAPVQMPQMPGM